MACAYDFHATFDQAIDPELHYYNHGKHQICIFWDVAKDRCASFFFVARLHAARVQALVAGPA